MAYIRTKKINGNKYAYLVEIINTDKGPRQKVKQYLGRVHELEKKKEIGEINEGNTKEEILLNLIVPELSGRGFKEREHNLAYKNFIFNPKFIKCHCFSSRYFVCCCNLKSRFIIYKINFYII